MAPRSLAADTLVCPFTPDLQGPVVLVNVYIFLVHCTPFFTSRPGPSPASTTWGRPVLLGMLVGTFMPVIIPPFFAYLYFVQEPKYHKGELKL